MDLRSENNSNLFQFVGNVLTFSFGLSTGWATINLPELESENTIFGSTNQLTKEEASLLVSCHNLGSIFGNFLTIPVFQKLGAKRTIHLFGTPLIVIIYFSKLILCHQQTKHSIIRCR